MIVHRLCRHDRTGLDGAGGLHADGRWHRLGSRIVYTSATASLALVEVRVHLEMAPRGWVTLEIELADSLIQFLDPATLPTGWTEARDTTQAAGEAWLRDRQSAVLAVPSVVVPTEKNYLLNPIHPASRQITVRSVTPFPFDPRLFRGPSS